MEKCFCFWETPHAIESEVGTNTITITTPKQTRDTVGSAWRFSNAQLNPHPPSRRAGSVMPLQVRKDDGAVGKLVAAGNRGGGLVTHRRPSVPKTSLLSANKVSSSPTAKQRRQERSSDLAVWSVVRSLQSCRSGRDLTRAPPPRGPFPFPLEGFGPTGFCRSLPRRPLY